MNYRRMVVGVEARVPLKNGKHVTGINFDNAATTPPFNSVLSAVIKFSPWYSSIHRGTGYKSKLSSELYEDSRYEVLKFVGADPNYYTAIFVKNTTEAINKLSYRLCKKNKKCMILSTSMEHHSNDLPWRDKYNMDYINVNADGTLSMEDLKSKLKKYENEVKLVAVTGASNVTGAKNPIYEIAKLCHKNGVKILVDGAQLVPHCTVDMGKPGEEANIDFLAFSAHKMYAPFGIGVLIGPKEVFKEGAPDYAGGGTVKYVTHDYVGWDDPPEKEEAGSPNVIGAAALMASIRTLEDIGMKNVEKHEKQLTSYALARLKEIPQVIFYDKVPAENRVGIIPFNIKGISYEKTAELLSELGGISVRCGCFCAQPYVQCLLRLSPGQVKNYINNPKVQRPGMVRISFGLYNTISEIDTFINVLKRIIRKES
jgi:cysteine desulfurase / selenocysteine lyase